MISVSSNRCYEARMACMRRGFLSGEDCNLPMRVGNGSKEM